MAALGLGQPLTLEDFDANDLHASRAAPRFYELLDA